MKRYRLLANLQIDTRRNILKSNGPAEIRESLMQELQKIYGVAGFEGALRRFEEISPPWARVIWPKLRAEYEVYDVYIFGVFYPTLVSACCLGEALLNELVGRLAKYFKHTPEYKKIYNKEWLQDWELMIRTLESWGIIKAPLVDQLLQLYELRKQSVHLRKLENVEDKAKQALVFYTDVVSALFGPSESLIFWCPGEMYIRREKESDLLVKEFFLPICPYVGYKHKVEGEFSKLRFVDDYKYEDVVIDDKQFRELRVAWRTSTQADVPIST